MRVSLLFLLSLGLASSAIADVILTDSGELKITPIHHGSVMLEIREEVWHVDPWSRGNNYSVLPKADVILITDIHADHMDPNAIEAISKPSTVIVAPVAVAKTITQARVISNGETIVVNGIKVEAIPMYNLKRGPKAGKLYHDKGRGNGYVLNFDGRRVYFSGDTEAHPEMKALMDIDVAFIAMNLPYTMPPAEAAEGVRHFKPRIVYPYHYRGSDLKQFVNALKNEEGIEVRILEWY